eukprot:1876078-Pleurochrysis_carterae.AAC.3
MLQCLAEAGKHAAKLMTKYGLATNQSFAPALPSAIPPSFSTSHRFPPPLSSPLHRPCFDRTSVCICAGSYRPNSSKLMALQPRGQIAAYSIPGENGFTAMAAAKAEAQRTKRQPPLPATPRSVQATETSFKVVESACTRSHRLRSRWVAELNTAVLGLTGYVPKQSHYLHSSTFGGTSARLNC